ncbi:DUF2512 family protein [Paenibacillus thailandensis]|uniref:DUF2512 family protein n=1 Tax=Paenibacillus thailandensis TaxID=393250 RepID=A0ABW5QU83_9BACL
MRFILKWLVNGVIVVSLLMFYADATFWSAAITATVLSVVAYFVGDLFILRATNNTVATIADAVLAFAGLWIAAYMMNWPLDATEILFATVLLGAAEWLFHRYLFGDRSAAV